MESESEELSKGKRITLKRSRPNPLFQDWLEELHEEAKAKKSKLESMLKEALSALSKYPLPLATGAECVILNGFNKKLCKFIDRRLEVYNSNEPNSNGDTKSVCSSEEGSTNSLPQIQFEDSDANVVLLKCKNSTNNSSARESNNLHIDTPSNTNTASVSTSSNEIASGKNSRKPKGDRVYKPVFRSGSYAILVALLEHSKVNSDKPSMHKEELIEKAQKHSEESFVRPKPESFYTAWSNMSTLVKKGLVNKTRHKKLEFSLTEQGYALATQLLEDAKNKPTVNDLIFNVETAVNDGDLASSWLGLDAPSSSSSADVLLDEPIVQPMRVPSDVTFVDMPAGSFDIILLIDKNETGGVSKKNEPTVAQFDKYPNLKHEYRTLKVGDFIWIARHKDNLQELVLPYIAERKRMDDLGSSIKDGRFHEQKFRLRKCGVKNVIYLVEKYGGNKHVGLPLQSLRQALANTRVQDGFKVHLTDSKTHTTRFLAMMTKRLTIEYKDKDLRGCNREPQDGELMTYDFFTKTGSKTKPLTVRDTFIKLLLQLKGVSVEKALAITEEYSTPSILIKKYETCNKKEGEALLAKLRHENSSCVGPVASKTIYNLFTRSQFK